ncbi:hypothetical protein CIW48_01620 [Methylobacterium sp. P1-11]|nr:hypothetical protein CIW48_01620 [Methylobacterium sp. P1-11]
MTVRTILGIMAVAITSAIPAAAEDGRSFEAWGHTFDVPGAQSGKAYVAAPRQHAVRVTPSHSPRHAYASGNAGRPLQSEAIVPAPASRTINVWGARLEVPAR